MKLKDIKLKTCPFCDGEGVLIHSKPDDGYIYSEGVHAFVKCKECDACGPMPDVEYNHDMLTGQERCYYRGNKQGCIEPYDKERV